MERGPEAVRAALIEAAADLFAEKGDASVRAIAQRAGVNHGLVHHYFGGKDGLRRAVVEHLVNAQAAELEAIDEADPVATAAAALAAARKHDRFLKILARALLDGESADGFQDTFPVVRRLTTTFESLGIEDAKVRLAHGLALGLGWMMFQPWITSATGLGDVDVDALIAQLVMEQLA